MRELDRIIDIRNATLDIKTTQIATVLSKYEVAKKRVTDEMNHPGNLFMDWVKDVDFLLKTFDELNALFVKKEQEDSEFMENVVDSVNEIEAEKERVAKVEKMLYTLSDKVGVMKALLQKKDDKLVSLTERNKQYDKSLVELKAEFKNAMSENKRLRKGLPPEKLDKNLLINDIKRENLTYNVKKAKDKYAALNDIQRWDIKKYPPASWPDNIDFLPPNPDNVDGLYPPTYDEKRLFIERKLLELDTSLWPTEEFRPTPRVPASDAKKLSRSYGLCLDCGITIKRVLGQGHIVDRCSKCRARYKQLFKNNDDVISDPDRMFEALTGLNYKDFKELFGGLDSLPDSHVNCPINEKIRKAIGGLESHE